MEMSTKIIRNHNFLRKSLQSSFIESEMVRQDSTIIFFIEMCIENVYKHYSLNKNLPKKSLQKLSKSLQINVYSKVC